MCQLTLIKTGDLFLNKLLSTCSLIVNSDEGNKDGWGIFQSPTNTFRSKNNACDVVNLGYTLHPLITNTEPILLHVRKASTNNGSKSICIENSHPFESKDFILMHNGSLFPKSEANKKKLFESKMIDSEFFLYRLQEIYDKNKNFVGAIKTTMKDFDGKFAFLIYSKDENKPYIVRGDTANLYYSDIFIKEDKDKKSIVGVIVNTDFNSLKTAFHLANQMVQSITGLWYEISTPTLLQKESIFELNGTVLVNIGKIEETYPVRVVVEDNYDYWNRTKQSDKVTTTSSIVDAINNFRLSPTELDLLCNITFNKPIICLNKEEVKQLGILLDKLSKLKNLESKKAVWKNITDLNPSVSPISTYSIFDLQFPYFMNDSEDLKSVYKEMKNADTNISQISD